MRMDACKFDVVNGSECGNWALLKGQFRFVLKSQSFVDFSAIIRLFVDVHFPSLNKA